jgi:hypothetical protein
MLRATRIAETTSCSQASVTEITGFFTTTTTTTTTGRRFRRFGEKSKALGDNEDLLL